MFLAELKFPCNLPLQFICHIAEYEYFSELFLIHVQTGTQWHFCYHKYVVLLNLCRTENMWGICGEEIKINFLATSSPLPIKTSPIGNLQISCRAGYLVGQLQTRCGEYVDFLPTDSRHYFLSCISSVAPKSVRPSGCEVTLKQA